MTASSPVERFGAQLDVWNPRNFGVYQIYHWAEGSLPSYEIHAIELAHATDELGGRCSGLQNDHGRPSSFV